MLTKNLKIILLLFFSTFSLTGCKETYNYEMLMFTYVYILTYYDIRIEMELHL